MLPLLLQASTSSGPDWACGVALALRVCVPSPARPIATTVRTHRPLRSVMPAAYLFFQLVMCNLLYNVIVVRMDLGPRGPLMISSLLLLSTDEVWSRCLKMPAGRLPALGNFHH